MPTVQWETRSGELVYTGNHTNPMLIAVLARGLVGGVLGGGVYLTRKERGV